MTTVIELQREEHGAMRAHLRVGEGKREGYPQREESHV